jgi:hypothetical protein
MLRSGRKLVTTAKGVRSESAASRTAPDPGTRQKRPSATTISPSRSAKVPKPRSPWRFSSPTVTAAGGTRVVMHRLATSQADITIEADSLRQFVAALPREVQGSIETSVANLWASGELDPPGLANGKQLSGKMVFAGLRMRLPESSRMSACLRRGPMQDFLVSLY